MNMLKVVDEIKKCEVTSIKVSRMLVEEGFPTGYANYARIECKGSNIILADLTISDDDMSEYGIKEGYLMPAFDVYVMNKYLLSRGNVFMKKERGIYEVRMEANDCSELYFGSARYLPDAMGMCILNYIRAKKVEDGKD